ncbi:response regulator [Sulfuricurvum sp.]|uniref:response regulator n=1 Tax=Sulfuricurvum sp. TaxID=2025608 RepID=UPI00198FED65|nr:response regulator [Sulfuricurvum sp.]MBD3806622.1 response regulator [Sulfuricurvum sp.]
MAKKVIFVDDSKSILKTISYTVTDLVNDGVITVETHDSSELFAQRLQEGSIEFDILFLDINMPVLSGYDIVKLARSLDAYKSKMIIALTTEISEESKKMGKEAGFNGWITKISSPEVMKSTITNTIRAINAKG